MPGLERTQARTRSQSQRLLLSAPKTGAGRIATVAVRETGHPVQFEVSEQTREAVAERIARAHLRSEDFLFPSSLRASPRLSTRQHARLVERCVRQIGLEPAPYGTHTIYGTNGSPIHTRTKNLGAVQLRLGHTKLKSTVRYLGIEVDDALEIAEQTEVQLASAGRHQQAGPATTCRWPLTSRRLVLS